jgi:hypothetical protein
MLGFDALGRLALGEIPPSSQTTTLVADPGSYAITGRAAGFKATELAATGSYLVTGRSASFLVRWTAGSGQYSITASNVLMATALSALSGVYSVTGRDTLFGARFVAESGVYTLTLGDFELRRTGYDYDPVQYGIGHIKLAMEEARRLSRVVKLTPYPVVRQLPTLRAPQPAPMQVAPVQGLIDNSEIVDRLKAAEQAQAAQQEAATRMQARNRAITVLLLAA